MEPFEHGGDIYSGQGAVLDFSVNVHPLGMPPEVIRAIQEGTAEDIHYPDPQCRRLRRAAAEYYGVAAEAILCGNGASDLLVRLCACLRPGRVLTAAPTFSEYARSAALFGGAVEAYPLRTEDGFAPDGGFVAAITPETDLVVLCNPNNPTGRLWPEELLLAAAERCRDTGTYLLVDECFLPFTTGRSCLRWLAAFPHLLVLRASTKSYAMAGLRLGFLLCADTALLGRIAAFGTQWSVSTVAQRAGLAALTRPDWPEKGRIAAAQERVFLAPALTALGLTVFPSDANFLLIKARRPLWDDLLERGIMTRRCENFQGLDGRFFRIGVKTPSENRLLLEKLKEVC